MASFAGFCLGLHLFFSRVLQPRVRYCMVLGQGGCNSRASIQRLKRGPLQLGATPWLSDLRPRNSPLGSSPQLERCSNNSATSHPKLQSLTLHDRKHPGPYWEVPGTLIYFDLHLYEPVKRLVSVFVQTSAVDRFQVSWTSK